MLQAESHYLDAVIEKLQAQKNTRALGNALRADADVRRRVLRATAEWAPEDRAELLAEVEKSHIRRIRSRPPGRPSSLQQLRGEWDGATLCVKGVLATAPAGRERQRYIETSLQMVWRIILGQKTAARVSLIRRAAAARTPHGIAFTLLYEAKGNGLQHPENLRRQLKAVKLQPAW